MKQFILLALLICGAIQINTISAVKNSTGFPVITSPAQMATSAMTVSDFLAFDVRSYRNAEGKKIGWLKRTAIQLTQKNLNKQIKKGAITGLTPVSEAIHSGNPNIHGLLSLIFAVAGLVIPYIGLALIIAALVLGIIGIQKDANPTLAIIGTVISAAFLAILLLAITILASGWGWY